MLSQQRSVGDHAVAENSLKACELQVKDPSHHPKSGLLEKRPLCEQEHGSKYFLALARRTEKEP